MPPVFTLGHSTRPLEELLRMLAEPGIGVLVDVRRYPGSRRHPQFSREALAPALSQAGIEYVHEPDLGGRRTARPGSPHTAWRVEAFRAYADHMDTPEFGAALERLIGRAAWETTAILCAEAVPWRCHRRLIADALVARGLEVRHLFAPGRPAEAHVLDPNARLLPDGRLLYAGPAGDQPSLFGDP